jgi:Ca-activated chloride channel family protein
VFWITRRATSQLAYSSLTLLDHTPRSWRQRLAWLPAGLLALAVTSLVVALARPQTREGERLLRSEGIAIMMVVDLSSSMDARDMDETNRRINRLDAVKTVFRQFVTGTDRTAGRGRPDDLIGMVTFAGYADSLCPLTLDHGNLLNIVQDLSIVSEEDEDGTAVGDGLGMAVERLRQSKAKSRVAILLTDGVTNAGVIDPLKAAELARQQDIKVYCIGAGTRGVAPVPTVDFFGRATFVARPVQIDEESLRKIAETTGGKYFRAVDQQALAEIYQEIDRLERTEVSEERLEQHNEHFALFVGSGLGLLACALLLNGSLFRRLP